MREAVLKREGREGKAKEGKERLVVPVARVVKMRPKVFLPFLRLSFPSFPLKKGAPS
jgi:hypothetical protein